MPDKYYLVESGALEKLLRTHFMLTQSTLLFEHLLSPVSYTHLRAHET